MQFDAEIKPIPPSSRWFRWAIAFVWLATGLLVLHPSYRKIGNCYLNQLGLPSWPMYVTCAAEVLLGAIVALRPARALITWFQIALITGFTGILAVYEPLLLANPFGMLSKNVPLVALIITTFLLDRDGWSRRSEWLLRAGMAVIWITEGLFPKILFQQQIELDVVANINPLPIESSTLLVILGAGQIVSGFSVLGLRGRLLSTLLAIQLSALVVLPILVSLAEPALWVHPFGPLTKNVPIIAGTTVVFLRRTPFLTADWSNLLLVTYVVPKGLLEHRLPTGVVLDTRDDRAFLSFVSLDFSKTRVLGVPWPWFRSFSDINLRFYVRRGEQRGVVFLREFVPFRFVTWIARTMYHEPFESAQIQSKVSESAERIVVERQFEHGRSTHTVRAQATKPAVCPPEDSDAHFFKERYWGFGKNRWGETIQHQVDHPVWKTYPVDSFEISLDWTAAYGVEWDILQDLAPASVVLAAGSPVRVWFTV